MFPLSFRRWARLLCALAAVVFSQVAPAAAERYDVCVYGATPAGIAATLAAAADGRRVVLVEPTSRIGGLVTNGLSHADFRTFEGLTGAYLTFAERVQEVYRSEFGEEAAHVSFRGTHAEPKVNLAVFDQMLAEQGDRVTLLREYRLSALQMEGVDRIKSIGVHRAGAEEQMIEAGVFIDGSYEGDLMAMTGEKWRVGREGRAEYGESLAPEAEDQQLQGYNFRLIMTKDPAIRVPPVALEGYRREDYVGVLPLLESGRLKEIFGYKNTAIYKAQIPPLPKGKVDINDMSHGPVRLSLPGENAGWPTGDASVRERIFKDHLRWNTGLLFFLQNDEAVPAKFRDEARAWGWCKDEFVENGHLPLQLYVREARRMVGQYVFTEKDTDPAAGDARSVLRPDAVAMGDYGPNCHGTAHEGSAFGGRHVGEFYKPVAPYQIPYGVLLPRQVRNLLVPGTPSASHVGFCALRLEPIWMSLGEAAGHAAHAALAAEKPVQEVAIAALQAHLHTRGAATVYVADVPRSHPDFAAVQWWGTAGGFHGLTPPFEAPGKRGANIVGQYYKAFPGHEAQLDLPLDAALHEKWSALAKKLGAAAENLPKTADNMTRGQFIRAAFAGAKPPIP